MEKRTKSGPKNRVSNSRAASLMRSMRANAPEKERIPVPSRSEVTFSSKGVGSLTSSNDDDRSFLEDVAKGNAESSSSTSSSRKCLVRTHVEEDVTHLPVDYTREDLNRIRSMKLRGLDEYTGDDSLPKYAEYWPTYVDVSKDEDDPTKERAPPDDTPEEVQAAVDEVERRIKHWEKTSTKRLAAQAPKVQADPNANVPFFSRVGKHCITKDHLRSAAIDVSFVERFFYHSDGTKPHDSDRSLIPRIDDEKLPLIYSDSLVRDPIAVLDNYRNKLCGRCPKASDVLRRVKAFGFKPFFRSDRRLRTGHEVRFEVFSIETLLDRISTADVFLAIVLFDHRDKEFFYHGHYYQLVNVDACYDKKKFAEGVGEGVGDETLDDMALANEDDPHADDALLDP